MRSARIFIITIFVCLLAMPVRAEDKVGLSVDQTTFAFDSAPGESQNLKLRIKNISPYDEIVKVDGRDLEIGDNNQIAILEGENELSGMRSWIRVNEKNLVLKSGEEKEVYFSINIPADATVGSHFSDIVLEAFPEITLENSQKPIVSGRIGVHILVNVLGEISGAGKVDNFEAPIVTGESADLKVEYENLGNIHYVPYGEFSLRNLLTGHEDVQKTEKRFVFPGKRYVFENQKSANPFLGFYLAKVSFVDGDGKLHSERRVIMGKYLAVVVLVLALAGIIWLWVRRGKKKSVGVTE